MDRIAGPCSNLSAPSYDNGSLMSWSLKNAHIFDLFHNINKRYRSCTEESPREFNRPVKGRADWRNRRAVQRQYMRGEWRVCTVEKTRGVKERRGGLGRFPRMGGELRMMDFGYFRMVSNFSSDMPLLPPLLFQSKEEPAAWVDFICYLHFSLSRSRGPNLHCHHPPSSGCVKVLGAALPISRDQRIDSPRLAPDCALVFVINHR